MKRRRPRKLTAREAELASRYVAEEKRTKKYPPKQAIAIGISRAKRRAAIERLKKKHRLT